MESYRKSVLIVSYAFPPTGGAGVQRVVKFVKYMRKYGYEPTVLTVENPSVPLQDKSLFCDIPDGVATIKAKTLEPSYKVKQRVVLKTKGWKRYVEKLVRNVLVPDPQLLWLPGLIKKAFSLRKNCFDLIFVTAPPFSALIAGVFLKFILKRPLIADFRDEWVGWLAGSSWSGAGSDRRLSFAVEKAMEKFVVKRSDAIITASPGYISAFNKKYNDLSDEKFRCIMNGFDPDDFRALSSEEKYNDILDKDKFNIIYMGTVWSATSLKYFLDGIEDMKSKRDVTITIIGRIVSIEESSIDIHENLNIVKLNYLPHGEAISLASQADALLVTLAPVQGAERIIPAKIFEYMALQKHIISIIPEGSTYDILSEYSGSIIVDPLDKEKITLEFQRLVEQWKAGSLRTINDNVEKHSRETRTKELCSLFDRLLN